MIGAMHIVVAVALVKLGVTINIANVKYVLRGTVRIWSRESDTRN